MTQPSSQIIMIDSSGALTDDPAQAVRGEVLEQLADGTTRSTLFVVPSKLSQDADVSSV